ncbi:MAG: transketolase [Bacteroidetes bacterium]|jgi:transketolase|nr:transketolase [Bacteroidota bacterium]
MSVSNEDIIRNLRLSAEEIRKRVVEIIYSAKGGHIGGSLSSVEIETALYFYVMNIDPSKPGNAERDRFILSKGHSVETLYATLAARGFIEQSLLDTYGQFNSKLAGHPTRKTPGVELNSGALGHGLSVGVGLAIGAKMSDKAFRTFVLMGDGEQGEGSIYEAAMSASHYKLGNLVAVIDRNTLQISGKTETVMALEPMRERWEAFGWEVFDVKGNDMEDIVRTFDSFDYASEKPKLIISHTTKGNGISFMENGAKWHHGVPNEQQYKTAIEEIDERIEKMKAGC